MPHSRCRPLVPVRSHEGCAHGAQDVRLAQECVDARLTGFPAWIINGRTLSGARTLEELEAELRQAPAPAPALAGQ